jgi:hypothetical protein
MQYNGVTEKKLYLLEKKLSELRSWQIGNFEEYIEPSILYDIVSNRLSDFEEYITEIRGFIKKKDGL